MKLLHKMVIPKISTWWKTVADFLELEPLIIDTIQEQCGNDHAKCCEEMLRKWLTSDNGLHPKLWPTLIGSIKDIEHLSTCGEEIEQELKSKIITVSSLRCFIGIVDLGEVLNPCSTSQSFVNDYSVIGLHTG